ASFSAGYNMGNKDIRHGIYFTGSYQVAKETASTDSMAADGSKFYSGNLSYRYSFIPGSWSLSLAINTYQSEIIWNETFTIGPTLIATKAFFEKKLRTSCSVGYSQVHTNHSPSGKVLTTRASA